MATPASPQPQRPQHASSPAPQPLTPGWLSAHFDPLPFPARTSALARYARALTPAAYTALHRALDAGNDHERHTALFLAVARRDLTTVATALADPMLRRRALSAAIRLPVPEQPLKQLALSPIRSLRHDTYRVLKLSRRQTPAEALLPHVYERYGADDAARLLTACSTSTVDTWLPRLDPPHGVLRTLARTAPVAVARLVADRYARIEPHDRRALHSFDRHYRALASLTARRDSHAGVVLVRAVPHLLEGRAVLAVLRQPAAVLEALRAAAVTAAGRRGLEDEPGCARRAELRVPPGPLPPSVDSALRQLSQEDLSDLADRCTEGARRRNYRQRHEVAPDGILLLLPPAERRRLVTRRTECCRRGLDAVSVTALAALEPEDRAELTATSLERWARSPRTASRRAVALPLEQAEPILLDLAAQHRIHHRALAWPALLACAELNGDPTEFARIATACERAWHDRDEIRLRTLAQLAGAPQELIAALPRNVLSDATLTTVQSSDTSRDTLLEADRLLRRTTVGAAARHDHENAAYSAGLLCELLNDPRHPFNTPPTAHVSRTHGERRRSGPVPALPLDASTAQALWAATESRIKDTPALCVPFAELLAPHLPHLPELDDRVHHIALTDDDPALAARAAEAWAAPHLLREQRCAELIAHDASFASVPRILNTLTTRRTDLLDQVIEAETNGLTGRLRPRATPWAPRITPAATGRWLPAQRRTQNQHYARVAQDETAPLHSRAAAASQLRDPDLLTALASDSPQPVAAAALTALGATHELSPDRDELPALLLQHAGTSGVRGRAAMAALRRLLAARPTDEAIALLGSVLTTPGTPVGSRKEAARALGELSDADAFDALLTAWDTEGQHRDVRAALARYLSPRIDRPDVADRLAHRLTEPAIRDVVLHARVEHDFAALAPAPAAYSAFLIRLLRSRETDRETAVAVCRQLPGRCAPDAESALQAVVTLIADPAREPEVWGAAAEALGHFPAEGTAARRVLPPLWNDLRNRACAMPEGDADPMPRSDALRRLTACADQLRIACGPGHGNRYTAGYGYGYACRCRAGSGPGSGSGAGTASGDGAQGVGEVSDGLADALEAVGLYGRAVRLRRGALISALLRCGQYRTERWERLLRAVEAREAGEAGEVPLSRRPDQEPEPEPHPRPGPAPDPALAAVRDLRARGTRAAAELALDLVRSAGKRASWPPEWRAELEALRGHGDTETAVEARLVDPDAG